MELNLIVLASLGTLLLAVLPGALFLYSNLFKLRDPLTLWKAIGDSPLYFCRNWIFTTILGFINPYSRTLPLKILELDQGRVVATVKEKNSLRNPFNSIHAVALCLLAETVGGLAMFTKLGKKDRGILKGLKMEYYKKARGTLTAESGFQLERFAGKREVVSSVRILDADLVLVAVAELTWSLELKDE
ncbi:Thioesterase/thiol ester dehydrase-isomerase [Basidiobolus meristosporus CBS 931.73]|uniref:Thioesterase/thiol ester dehydrase-isomerase n=1 Tax=Basidiobolus meristosporus CBS 931.73 TaxID=1314790 RepID=A0A1Y1XK13_9FUNG|nr:Thioesterase/thiol ester dehydrase-isomerase [Basidiobolus meristosporus CBS 931.73]|eukprot:ORX86090.1 Thioesterase/thiol ester dehydrase-isomerase [Basidiobolus meristosporus CBS 931.73]